MRVLAILYCYPPLLVPAAICYLKLVLGLRQKGVDVEILTITPESFSAPGGVVLRDTELARVAPADVVEHRFTSPETSLAVRALKRFDRRRRVVYRWLEPKKREWLWPAARFLRRQDLRRFDVILSCSQPHANHLLGMDLQRRTGLPWVAYFSDPWSDNPYAMFASENAARHNRKLEDRVLASADRVLFTSDEMRKLVLARHPVLEERKTGVLPHAFVPEWYGPETQLAGNGKHVRMLHTGHFYGPRTPAPLFEALARLRARKDLAHELVLTSYGTMPDEHIERARKLGLEQTLRLEATVPYLESLALMRAHDILLLVDAKLSHWSESVFLPSKLVDYLGAGKPVVAITPREGASARVVRETGGTVCDIEDPAGIDRALAAIVTAPAAVERPCATAVQEYALSHVAGRFVGMLDDLIRERCDSR